MIQYIQDKIASLQFWLASRRYQIDRDFKLVIEPNNKIIVEILTGKFKSVRVEYSGLSMRSLGEGGILSFDTIVVANPSAVNITTKRFQRTTTNILRLLILNSLKVNDENRESDSFELDEERDFCEEDPPVRKARVSKRKPRKKAIQRDK